MKKLILFTILFFSSLKMGEACQCTSIETFDHYFAATAIFVGKVIEIDEADPHLTNYTFQVKNNFKGPSTERINIFADGKLYKFYENGKEHLRYSSCVVSFDKDKEYLIYAYKDIQGRFATDSCGGNLPLPYANQEIHKIEELLKIIKKGAVYKEYYPSGALRLESPLQNGTPGQIKEYYESGGVKRIREEGRYKNYDEKGRLINAYERLDSGESSSLFYFESGQILREIHFKDDKDKLKNRNIKTYYPNGKLKSNEIYENSKKVKEEYYSENGVLFIEQGDNPLIRKEYFPSGQLQSEATIRNGVKDGPGKAYSFDGHLIEENNFNNGKRHGLERKYYKNGQLFAEENYKNDLFDGPKKTYYQNGNLKSEGNFKAGAQVENEAYKDYFENGQLKAVRMNKNGYSTTLKLFDENGKILEERELK